MIPTYLVQLLGALILLAFASAAKADPASNATPPAASKPVVPKTVPLPRLPAPVPLPVVSWQKEAQGISIQTSGGILKLEPFLNGVLHVTFGSQEALEKPAPSYVVLRTPESVSWTVADTNDTVTLETDTYKAAVNKTTGALALQDATGHTLLEEPAGGGRAYAQGTEPAMKQIFVASPDEALYGLGQHPGELELTGKRIELVQFNTRATVPVLLSTRGWSILWDNPSRSAFANLPSATEFMSDRGNAINYYVMVGAKFDDLVARYRELTGPAPMFPKWAYGYHQSRNRYASQKEITSVLQRMRDEKIPDDSIFLDYKWWDIGIGSHLFKKNDFPDPKGMVDAIHALHSHLILSVWPAFDAKTKNYQTLHDAGFLLDGVASQGGTYYDPFNPQAAAAYWKLIADQIVPLGVDGWFLDGPEPDNPKSFLSVQTFAGPGLDVQNLYPLMHTTCFYQGLRQTLPNQRVYIITRCGYAGQQRNATVVWSGDIKTTFAELKAQIPSGLDLTASGIPYWTTDVGGYAGGIPTDPAYQEVYTRWFEYGTFCPIFRSHGKRITGKNELWEYGPKTENICVDYDNLRYRLLPYIYSLAGKVTQDSYTMMRALAFDFPTDTTARELKDEFMFGPAFLVCPVTDAGATNRSVYLPSGANWIDFWTGQSQPGGQTVTADAPIEKMPLYVRAGSILPMGPLLQYTNELPADPLELRIYPGADADFTLYEDDGASYDYEKGAFSTLALHWDNKAQTLRIGARQGSFPGMLASRTFNIVWVDASHGTGSALAPKGRSVNYDGAAVEVRK